MAAEKIYAHVLAGGGSTRFGRDKALVEFGGVPLLLQIVRLARSCTPEVAVVASREKYASLSPELQIIEDRWPGQGPLGGIITALQHTSATDAPLQRTASATKQGAASTAAGEAQQRTAADALRHNASTESARTWNLVLSCDLPFLTREWLQFLVSRALAARPETQIILPNSAHGPEPLCACYRTDSLAPLQQIFERGVRKVTEALKHLPTEVLDDSVWKRFDSAGRLFWNMNTPADFAEAQRLWETNE
ncbi:MAG TPA: molybdenum cofactor guanylyltransferase [Candidatus Acidoferrum sp.]|jgi:molybdopterin-guanine dinucleotide biosynthesis protein A